ncbi:MAG: GNAT family N-acetyltransferase [Thermodesulfobacteriota bacterium]
MELRPAGWADAEGIARLHAESWRDSYRGILTDEYLDHWVFEDRLALWRKRFEDPKTDPRLVLLIEDQGGLLGFVCVLLDADPRWGALLDNLHIRPDFRGQGLGRKLMAEAAAWVVERRPGSGLYLWVFEDNFRARRFYERLGGAAGERRAADASDGRKVMAVRYSWTNLDSLYNSP